MGEELSVYSFVRNTEASFRKLAVILRATSAIGKSQTHPIPKESCLKGSFVGTSSILPNNCKLCIFLLQDSITHSCRQSEGSASDLQFIVQTSRNTRTLFILCANTHDGRDSSVYLWVPVKPIVKCKLDNGQKKALCSLYGRLAFVNSIPMAT